MVLHLFSTVKFCFEGFFFPLGLNGLWNPAGVGFEGSKSFSLMVLKQLLSKCPADLHVNWPGRSAEAVNKSEFYLHNKWKKNIQFQKGNNI